MGVDAEEAQVFVRMVKDCTGEKTQYVIRLCPSEGLKRGEAVSYEHLYKVDTRRAVETTEKKTNEWPDFDKSEEAFPHGGEKKTEIQPENKTYPTDPWSGQKENPAVHFTKESSNLKLFQIRQNMKCAKEGKGDHLAMHTSYGYTVDLIKKMSSNHWEIISNLIRRLNKDKYIKYDFLCGQITSIVLEVYGPRETQNFLNGVDSNRRKCITKLSRILLNLYQEAYNMYYEDEDNKKNSQHSLNWTSRRADRCMACKLKNTTVAKKRNCEQGCKGIINRPKNIETLKNNGEKNLMFSKVSLVNNKNSVKKLLDDVKPLASKACINDNLIGYCLSSETIKKKVEVSKGSREILISPEAGESKNLLSREQVPEVHPDSQENGKEESCPTTKEYEMLHNLEKNLFTLFSTPEPIPKDLAKAQDSLSATMSLFWLNERIEKRSQEEAEEQVGKMDNLELSEDNIMEAKLKSGWLSGECALNLNCVSICISVMFGIAAAYFARDQEFGDNKPIKATLKNYLIRFLEGALHLVNGF